MLNQSTYTLRALMYQKYTEEKFAVGCEYVARWINFELRDIPVDRIPRWTMEDVIGICDDMNCRTSRGMVYEEAEALRQLFGLQSINQLYTNQ